MWLRNSQHGNAICVGWEGGTVLPEGFHLLLQLCIFRLGDAQLLRQVGTALLQPAVVPPARQLPFQLLQHSSTLQGSTINEKVGRTYQQGLKRLLHATLGQHATSPCMSMLEMGKAMRSEHMQASLVYICSRDEQDMWSVCCAAHLDLIEGQCRMYHHNLCIM